MSRLARISIFLIIAILFFWLTQKDFNIKYIYLFLFLFLFAIVLFVINLYKDIKEFKVRRSFHSFLSTIICMIITVSLLILLNWQPFENKSPIILFASHDSGVGGSWFEFRKDSTYKFTSGTPLGESTVEGTYELIDSMIIINTLPEGNLVKSKRFILRNNPHSQDMSAKLLWQLNSQGSVDSNLIVFIVYNVQASK